VPDVAVRLLGSPTVVVGGREEALPANAPASLLAYLAVVRDWVPRSELAYLYRPDESEAQALQYLRLQLHRAQRLPWATGLRVEPQRVRFDVASDVAAFADALGAGDVAAAIDAYGGPLLAGYAMRGRPTFDTWIELERGALEGRYRGVLEQAAARATAAGAHDRSVEALVRLADLDDLDEDALAALLRALVRAGRRAEARRRYDAFADRLQREVGAEPLPTTLAALEAEPEARVSGGGVARGDAGERAPARPRLPEPATRFVGREAELADLEALLDAGETRLVTLLGLGGAGKTRLALELARRREARHADGALFVPLAGVEDGDLFAVRVTAALGLEGDEGGDAADAIDEAVRGALARRDVLLVLDEFEPLAAHAGRLGAWLAGDGAARVVVTSRRRLALQGEAVVDLAGLRTETAPDGEPSDAVALFVGAARRVAPRLTFGAPELEAAQRIAARSRGCRWRSSWPRPGCAPCPSPPWRTSSKPASTCSRPTWSTCRSAIAACAPCSSARGPI
jgi:DNA-binding SARP family transcriptional activator